MATSTQRTRFRRYFGDPGTVWTDDEIDAIFEEATEDAPNAVMIQARIIGIDELRMNATKLTNYKQNQSSENQSDIFKALTTMRKELVAEKYDAEEDAAGTSVRVVNTAKRPARTKDYPSS